MITVQGYIDDEDQRPISYAVEVGHPEADSPGYKISAGTTNALALLRSRDGDQVSVHATAEPITADAGTPEGVLAILTAFTEVTSVDGDDVPDVLGPDERGHVY